MISDFRIDFTTDDMSRFRFIDEISRIVESLIDIILLLLLLTGSRQTRTGSQLILTGSQLILTGSQLIL